RICAQTSSSALPSTSKSSRPNGSRISCRGCGPPPPARLPAPRKWCLTSRDGFRVSYSLAWKRHRLDAVAVGVDDERRVVFPAVLRTQARRAVGAAARCKRRSVERIDFAGGFCAKADMDTAFGWDRRHAGAQVDPEFGIGLSETDCHRPSHQFREAECGQRRLIEARGAFEIGDSAGAVVQSGYDTA